MADPKNNDDRARARAELNIRWLRSGASELEANMRMLAELGNFRERTAARNWLLANAAAQEKQDNADHG
jgi:hypothetical protein